MTKLLIFLGYFAVLALMLSTVFHLMIATFQGIVVTFFLILFGLMVIQNWIDNRGG